MTHYIFRRSAGVVLALPADLLEREAEHVTLECPCGVSDFMASFDERANGDGTRLVTGWEGSAS